MSHSFSWSVDVTKVLLILLIIFFILLTLLTDTLTVDDLKSLIENMKGWFG